MLERIRRLYLAGSVDDMGLGRAVEKGWITAAEADALVAEKRASP